jgi:hypothetical protein
LLWLKQQPLGQIIRWSINMRTIQGEQYWEKRDVLNEFPISERTFFTRIKKFKSIYPSHLMNNKCSYWVIHNSIINEVFKVEKRPRKNEVLRWKKYINHIKWDIIGNIRPIETNVNGNIQIMNFLFDILNKNLGKTRGIEMVYCIENNNEGNNQHSHFLIKIEMTSEEFNHIQDEVFNLFPNHDFQRYNHQLSDSGIKYTSKHIGEDINRFGYLTNEFNGK